MINKYLKKYIQSNLFLIYNKILLFKITKKQNLLIIYYELNYL
jgi:hypothetical protein